MRERPVEVCRTSACEHITGFLALNIPGRPGSWGVPFHVATGVPFLLAISILAFLHA